MGKGGRAACITTPFLLTIASFICLILIEVAGWSKSTLPNYYFLRMDFSDLDIAAASNGNPLLSVGLGQLADYYQIHLWNYCSADNAQDNVNFCSARQAEFSFNPAQVWGSQLLSGGADGGQGQDIIDRLQQRLLGDAAQDALRTYQKASKAMWILYAITFFTLIVTILASITAIFSRWGSLVTWIFASLSTVLYIAATATATAIFWILRDALNNRLEQYDVSIKVGHNMFVVAWLGAAFILVGTLFWLFSICCCSGRSNPHHKSNKGGLWNASRGNEYHEKGAYRGSQSSSNMYEERGPSPYAA